MATAKPKFALGFPLALTFLVVTSSANENLEVIDLTHDLTNNSIGWPVHPPFNFTIVQRGNDPALNNVYLEYNKFEMGEHRGTHTDSPAHFAQGHWRSDQIPPSRLVGPGVVIDVSAKARSNPAYKMTVDDILAWEEKNGRIPNGAVVLMNAGWSAKYPDPAQVFSTSDISNPDTYTFPTFHADVGKFLAENRSIIAAGGDVPSPDNQDPAYPVHLALLPKDILILENVANVDQLPATGTTIVIGMVKIRGGSGGPSRILALKGGNFGTCGGHSLKASAGIILAGMMLLTLLRRAA